MSRGHADGPPASLEVRVQSIPRELRGGERFVAWRYEWREKDEEWTKPPVNPHTGGAASVTDPSTWSDFIEAVATHERLGLPGIGRVLVRGDQLVGIDLDKCRRADGTITAWALAIVRRLHSYTEVSPSGRGLRIFCRGSLPPGRRVIPAPEGGKIEMYDTVRYLTLTGWHLDDTPTTVEERTSAVATFHEDLFGRPHAHQPPADPVSSTLEDDEILERARYSVRRAGGLSAPGFRALFDGGDIAAYGADDSSADMGLCNELAAWTNRDRTQMDRLFRLSALMRPKWDERRPWGTYGSGTINLAVGLERDSSPPAEQSSNGAEPSPNGSTPPPPASEDEPEPEPVPGRSPHRTDVGNGIRFVRHHGKTVRHCHPWGKWLVWDSTRWALDQVAAVELMAKSTARSIFGEASRSNDPDERKALSSWAVRSEAAARLTAMLQTAASEPGVPVIPGDLDADPWLLNCENGTLDLHTGVLRGHRPEDRITKLAPVTFDPAATCPRWTAFLERIFAGRADLIAYVQRLVGYCLVGVATEDLFAILYGEGRNGKSRFIGALIDTLGEYATTAPPSLLMSAGRNEHPTVQTTLWGRRLVACIETAQDRQLNEELVKALTGGDRISARRMREDFWEFIPTHTILLATNHKPVIRGTDLAIWRRVRLIPFSVVIPENEQDRRLGEKLRAETPGILRWAVDGCLAWQRDGLAEPLEVTGATGSYRAEMDTLGEFLAERCLIQRHLSASAGDLYAAYREWCSSNGEPETNQKGFGGELTRRGLERYRGPDDRWRWRGIGLRAREGQRVQDE